MKLDYNLGDDYEVLDLLGRGATAVVLKARYKPIDRVVAVKILSAETADLEAVRRLIQEGKALVRLEHPNIVKVLHVDTMPNGAVCLVMEFVEGKTLAKLIEEQGAIPSEMVRTTFRQCAQALQAMHQVGIVHRDLKPGNILIAADTTGGDAVKILDFGLAKLLGECADQKLTRTGALLGTPAYMSPEQCTASAVDARSDIYSLGCVMYHALTGELPHPGDSSMEVIYKHAKERIKQVTVDDTALANIIWKCTETLPADRFRSAQELIEALDAGTNYIQGSAVLRAPASQKHGAAMKVMVSVVVICALAGALMFIANQNPDSAYTYAQMDPNRLAIQIEAEYEYATKTPPQELIDAVESRRSNLSEESSQRLSATYLARVATLGEKQFLPLAQAHLRRNIASATNKGRRPTPSDVSDLAWTYLPENYAEAKRLIDEQVKQITDPELAEWDVPFWKLNALAAAVIANRPRDYAQLKSELHKLLPREKLSRMAQASSGTLMMKTALKLQPNFYQ